MNRKTIEPSTGAGILSTRDLNRALLARQMLLRRRRMSAESAIEHLVGMQSQMPNSPYVGLWTRLAGFSHSELVNLYNDRKVVRLAMMRSTIHLVTAEDCLSLRPILQPAIERAFASYARLVDKNHHEEVTIAGRAMVEEDAATFSDLERRLGERWPERHGKAMSNMIRTRVPLVQVTPRGIWGASGSASHTSAERWLGKSMKTESTIDDLMLRYLAAFGPATVIDAQSWSGLLRLDAVFDRLRPKLVTFRNDKGRELFDLPNAPRPSADGDVPVRFLPEFDNVLLAYKDRRRIIADEYRSRVYPTNGVIQPTMLVDGFVEGKWRIVATDTEATLSIDSFRRFTKTERAAIEAEGEKLVDFVAGKNKARDIKVSGPGRSA